MRMPAMDTATPRPAPGAEACRPEAYRPTARAAVKRLPKRGHSAHATVTAVLDAGVISHIGYATDGQPFLPPPASWRAARLLHWPGSAARRMTPPFPAGPAPRPPASPPPRLRLGNAVRKQ